MRTHVMRAVGAVVAAVALAAFGLADVSGAGAAAATGSPTAGQAAKVPAGFQPASASFRSAASGAVLGGVGCTPSHVCPALLAATADGGAHWHLVAEPNDSSRPASTQAARHPSAPGPRQRDKRCRRKLTVDRTLRV